MNSFFVGSETGPLLQTRDPLSLKPGFVRVQVKALGFNPLDFKAFEWGIAQGKGLGGDFAGTVSEVLPGSALKVGQRVSGWVPSYTKNHPEYAGFANEVVVLEDALILLDAQSFEAAATSPAIIETAAFMLDYMGSIPLVQDSQSGLILVYGASSGVGYSAIQLAHWLGFEVVAVASSKHKALLSKIGVKHFVDYKSPEWPEKVKAIGPVSLALTPFTEDKDLAQIERALAPGSVKIIGLGPSAFKFAPNVKYQFGFLFSLYALDTDMGLFQIQGNSAFFERRPEFFKQLSAFASTYVPLPIEVLGSGLDLVPQAIERVKTASGERIAITL